MKKEMIIGIIVLVVVLAGFYLVGRGGVTGNVVANDVVWETTKVFEVTGENFKFVMDGIDNPTIRVKEGERVRVDFTSTKGFHDFVIDAFGATEQVRDGEGTTFVEFVADKKGEFEYYCSVGKHKEMGMFGKFIVE